MTPQEPQQTTRVRQFLRVEGVEPKIQKNLLDNFGANRLS
jgi:hypothetical protein